MGETVEELSKRVEQLSAIVEKQSKLLSKTGQQLIEIQVNNVKKRLNGSESGPKSSSVDLSDYASNEDIVQLVSELQSQLDFLEERTINRLYNSKLSSSLDEIIPLTNRDGDHIPDVFPKTLKDFDQLDKGDVVKLAEFYELIGPEESNLEELLKEATSVSHAQSLQEKGHFSVKVEKFTDAQITTLRADLSRYLGLSPKGV